MNKIQKILASVTVFMFLITFAISIYAAPSYSRSSDFWPIVQCGNAGQHDCDFVEATILVNRIINWFISMAGVIAVITFTIAGGRILLNPANPGERQAGWAMFQKTVWGMLIVLGAWLLVNTAVSALVRSQDALRFLSN